MTFFRMFQHLLPRSVAWRLSLGTTIRRFFEGLTGAPSDARAYIDYVYDDLAPETTRALAEWERAFGLSASIDDASRRLALAAEWRATGGQSPSYLQGVMQAAGFDVYVHEWWSSGPPWVPRDPRDYTNQPLSGTVQCGEPDALCGEPDALCNEFLANEVFYLVNRNLTNVAPPAVPDDAARWPFFLYWGGPVFGETAPIPAARRAEFERLLLKICPLEQWLVTIVTYIPDGEDVIVIDGAYLIIDGAFVTVAS